MRPYLKKTHHKKRMLEWHKGYALSSNPIPEKKKKKKRKSVQLKFSIGLAK
jgi:hypothetical protein